jgi:hypothetical protein
MSDLQGVREIVLDVMREADGQYVPEITASWVARQAGITSAEARTALLELATPSAKGTLLEMYVAFRCPDHDTILTFVKQGEQVPADAQCPEGNEWVRLDEALAEVIFRPGTAAEERLKKAQLFVP